MLIAIAILLLCQLAGETISRAFNLPVPGPVIGLVLLALALTLRPVLTDQIGQVARTILANLSLLFVPAGVGVIGNLGILSENALAFVVILVVSTIMAMLVSVGTFLLVLRAMGAANE